MLKKIFNAILLALATVIVLVYITGYGYLFRGVKLTYLKGNDGPTIDDGKYFPSKEILKGSSKPWPADPRYNHQKLSPALEKNLLATETVSFLVIKNGKLLQEHYWDGYDRNTASNSFSMANTIMVLLLGKAIDDQRITNLYQPFYDFYPEFGGNAFSKKLTLENLASMQAGLDWPDEHKNPLSKNARAYYGSSLSDVIFKDPVKENPGETFQYQSGAMQMLGFAVGRAVQMPLSVYASAKLWKPLGMENNAFWSTDDLGVEKTFCCVQSNARDFAKIGYLILNKGKIGEIPLIDEGFVTRMKTPSLHSNGVYGMGLWINNDTAIKHYYMWGLHDQFVIMVPEYDMIIVRQGRKENPEKDSKNRPKVVEFYINEALKLANANQSAL